MRSTWLIAFVRARIAHDRAVVRPAWYRVEGLKGFIDGFIVCFVAVLFVLWGYMKWGQRGDETVFFVFVLNAFLLAGIG